MADDPGAHPLEASAAVSTPSPPNPPDAPPVRSPASAAAIWLFVVVFGHFVGALLYSQAIPYRTAGFTQGKLLPDIGAPDERAHANLVQSYLDGKPHPVLDPDDPNLGENYQAHQPPLYYFATAAVLRAIGREDVTEPVGGLTARALNSLVSAVNVAGVFALVVWMRRGRRVALTAAAIVAAVPMNFSLAASVNNDVLLFTLCTWCLAFLARAANPPPDAPRYAWPLVLGCAVCLGLAVLTKTTGLLLFAPVLLVALWPRTRASLPALAALLLIPVLINTPWWLRNVQVYGEPLATTRFAETFKPDYGPSRFETPFKTYRWARALSEVTIESSTGVFGYFDIHYPDLRVPAVLGWVAILGAWIGALLVQAHGPRRELTALLLFLGLVLAAYIRFNMTYAQPQARYLFPALPVVAWLMAETLARFHYRWTGVWIATYALLNIFTLDYIRHEFDKRVEAAIKVTGRTPFR